MNKLEDLRRIVDGIIAKSPFDEIRREGWVHLYGVSQACTLLARRRGLDPLLAGMAGMLHDIATIEKGDGAKHAKRGAERAGEILNELGLPAADIDLICHAILCHSHKKRVDGPFDELLKDADILQRYLYDEQHVVAQKRLGRAQALVAELGGEG